MFFLNKKPTLFSAIQPKDPWGGSFTFTKHLLHYLENNGWKITFNPKKKFDVAYATGWFLNNELLEQVTQKAPLLFRMDGRPSLYRIAQDEHASIQERQMELQANLASHVVFQSQFCVDTCSDWKVKKHSIILNGTDQNIFYPNTNNLPDPEHLTIVASSWSSNLNKGMPLFKRLAELFPQHEFRFMGNWPKDISPGPVSIFPAEEQKVLSEFLRKGDLFIHLAINDPCPNVILEALSSGLPVLHRDSGGSAEIAKNYGQAIENDVNDENLKSSFESFVIKYQAYRDNIQQDMNIFSIQEVAKKYMRILSEITS